jgi:hypothetical protein
MKDEGSSVKNLIVIPVFARERSLEGPPPRQLHTKQFIFTLDPNLGMPLLRHKLTEIPDLITLIQNGPNGTKRMLCN